VSWWLYLEVLADRKMCLCGMLAAEYQTLPQPMQDAVIRYR
jgi:TetR/AcrR family transcriptional repressor of nem operon